VPGDRVNNLNMPPKKEDQDFKQLCENVSAILAQQAVQTTKLNDMEKLLKAAQQENQALKEENVELRTSLANCTAEVDQLKLKMHALETHNRSFSVRVNKFKIAGDASCPLNVRQQVFEGVFRPILEGAKQEGKLDVVPPASAVIEMAHVLPGKEGAIKPIICRFQSRIYKGIIMTHKKTYAEREEVGASAAAARQGRPPPMRYPISEDLPRQTYVKMVELGRDERVASCWSVGGHLRYRLVNAPTIVKRVVSVFDNIEEIIG